MRTLRYFGIRNSLFDILFWRSVVRALRGRPSVGTVARSGDRPQPYAQNNSGIGSPSVRIGMGRPALLMKALVVLMPNRR